MGLDGVGSVDMLVVGSGLGGMMSAIRAHDLGLKTVMIEKSHVYGGTSALSGGGIWIPVNPEMGDEDSHEKAMSYLRSLIGHGADERKLRAYVENAATMVDYARSVGVNLFRANGYPDYFSELPDAVDGRQMLSGDFDGKRLGDEFFRMRQTYPAFMAFGRYALNLDAAYTVPSRQKGWLWAGFKLVAGYWADIAWRLKTARDSRLSMGQAFVGALRKAMMERGIPLILNTRLVGIEKDDRRVTGVRVLRNGNEHVIPTRAVMLATGGFEHSQAMRDTYHSVRTEAISTLTPQGGNEGDAILAGQKIGADLDNMDSAWWVPTIRLPGKNNTAFSGQVFFDRSRPGIIAVNRLGNRFCNEALSYDRFGQAMIQDHRETGANLPSWLIFDAKYRHTFPISDILPGWVRGDKYLPQEFWDAVLFRADTVAELAAKIELDPKSLEATVERFNTFAKSGKDLDFHRGDAPYDKFFGDARAQPNSNLRPISKPPFYAVKVELGDIGTKGGLRVDEHARVISTDGEPIEGLYATGNTTGSVFRDVYPGAGSTLGPAMVFGFLGAGHAASLLGGEA